MADTYQLEYEGAALVSIATAPSHVLVFDATIFHPKGGGQPSDKGVIVINGKHEFTVDAVLATVAGVIEHIVTPLDVSCKEQIQSIDPSTATVRMRVDEELRMKHAALHSGGHALDAALLRIDPLYSMRLKATKGYHFLDGPNVEYDLINGAKLSPEELSSLPGRLNDSLRDIVEEDITTVVSTVSKVALGADLIHYPDYVRVVTVAGFAIPCGGTHVKSTRELGCLQVKKAKVKKGVLKISYDFVT